VSPDVTGVREVTGVRALLEPEGFRGGKYSAFAGTKYRYV